MSLMPIGRGHLRATVDDDLGERGLDDGDGTFERDAERFGHVEADLVRQAVRRWCARRCRVAAQGRR